MKNLKLHKPKKELFTESDSDFNSILDSYSKKSDSSNSDVSDNPDDSGLNLLNSDSLEPDTDSDDSISTNCESLEFMNKKNNQDSESESEDESESESEDESDSDSEDDSEDESEDESDSDSDSEDESESSYSEKEIIVSRIKKFKLKN